MSEPYQHAVEHTAVVAASPETVYGLVADVRRWPVIFEPSLHVTHLEHTGDTERFRIWALVSGEVRTWTSRRTLDPDGLRIGFQQEHSRPPVRSMGGDWRFRPLPGGRTQVVLSHRFTVDGGPESVDWMLGALNANSERELAALNLIAGTGHQADDLVFTFEDRLRLPGTAGEVYDFINRSDLWPRRLPHVSRVLLRERPPAGDPGGVVQDMEMETLTADGHTHTTRSVRLCFPNTRIVYKQLVPPALLLGHSGAWEFADAADGGVDVVARHTVAINADAVPAILGEQSTIGQAREHLRSVLGANSRATLTYAGEHARPREASGSLETGPRAGGHRAGGHRAGGGEGGGR